MSYYAILDDIPCRAPCNRYNIFTYGVLSEYVIDRSTGNKKSLIDLMKNPQSSVPNGMNPTLNPDTASFETYKNVNLSKCNCSIYNRSEDDGYNKSLTWVDQEQYRKKLQNKPLV